MADLNNLQAMLNADLITAGETGHSERRLSLDGRQLRVTISTSSLRILVCTENADESRAVQLLNTVRQLLAVPPDAVFTRGDDRGSRVEYCALWGNPALDFREELSPLVPEIYAPGHQVLLISDRLRAFLIPDHPAAWTPDQVDLWLRFWRLRLENPHDRERIKRCSHPDTWDYFDVLAGRLAAQSAAEMAPQADHCALQPEIETLFRTAALTGYHVHILGQPVTLDLRQIAFSRVVELVPQNMGWNTIPEHALQVVNEINVSDIRASGDLFKRAALMAPEILDGLLLNANKCAVLGYATAALAHRLKAEM